MVSFWVHGNQSLGMRTIAEETGLSVVTVCTEVGGKDGLLVEAMEAYTRNIERHVIAALRQSARLE